MDRIFEKEIELRLKEHSSDVYYGDFLDDVLKRQDELDPSLGYLFSRKEVKALLMDMFLGGTDTSAVTLEWGMTELIRNPKAMKKAKEEVRQVAGNKGKIEESDIEQLQYLKMVVKETLRLHPPTTQPDLLHGVAHYSKKGEDFTFLKTDCQRVHGNCVSEFSVFGIFDGHNGSAAAKYAKENLLNNVLGAIPSNLDRDKWLAVLPRALVAGFVKTDKDFQDIAQTSGTTATFVIIDGWVITVASVGDSRCILESEGSLYILSADHRLDVNVEEVERITASGGEVGRLHVAGGAEIGPLRCWPGGLCLSRSIGDLDVGEFIVPIPHVKQVKLSTTGGRIIISSDGVWDALSFESALQCCRGLPSDAAANQIVKDAIQFKGLRDDTTCIVVDVLPLEKTSPPMAPPKKQGIAVFKKMFRKKSSESSSHHSDEDYVELDIVEEIFEDGSAVLAERLDLDYPICTIFGLFSCAVCQVNIKPGEGISVHAGSSKSGSICPWDGPLLCASCQAKKEAMEGKKPSRDSSIQKDGGE